MKRQEAFSYRAAECNTANASGISSRLLNVWPANSWMQELKIAAMSQNPPLVRIDSIFATEANGPRDDRIAVTVLINK
jgi:hypothetical protein